METEHVSDYAVSLYCSQPALDLILSIVLEFGHLAEGVEQNWCDVRPTILEVERDFQKTTHYNW